ncbi:MAG TPA: alpha/beta hydrolase [Burkholderiaceae bacterium]|nr:alpha/beta hydrolase [Burkholderiaceae bacterium]
MRHDGRDQYLDVPGARLRFRDTGAGCAVILLHGWTLGLEMWDLQAAALAQECRVVRFDRRGFGLSTGTASVIDDAADVTALCTHLGIRRAALVGMSQGSRVAVRTALTQAALIGSLVLDGPSPGIIDPLAPDPDLALDQFRQLARRDGIEAFRRMWAQHPMTHLRTREPGTRALLDGLLARYRGEDLLQMPEPGLSTAALPPLESIAQPTLIICGAFDVPSRRNTAAALAQRLPSVELFQVADAGHLANLDNPSVYNAALLRFLRRHAFSAN